MIDSHGYIRVATASPQLKIADIRFNTNIILKTIDTAISKHCQILVFPELCITGYTCGDLFYQQILIEKAEETLFFIAEQTKTKNIFIVLGLPVKVQGKLYNCAALLCAGEILGIVPKTHLPNTNEFYEKRWFCGATDKTVKQVLFEGKAPIPFGTDLLFAAQNLPECIIGVEICEDLWAVNPPSGNMAINGATIICNPSASNDYLEKVNYRRSLVKSQSARCIVAYIYSSCGPGESTTDLVYSGHSIIAESGTLLKESARFDFETCITVVDVDIQQLVCQRLKNSTFFTSQTPGEYRSIPFVLPMVSIRNLLRPLSRLPFVPNENKEIISEEVFSLQTTALIKRIQHIGIRSVVIGVSGGLDSTLALLVCVRAFEQMGFAKEGIFAITMPGMGTTKKTKNNALHLIKELGVSLKVISIKKAVHQHFLDIGQSADNYDITYENAQARERTQILMDVANQNNAIVIGTGDLSELALGWCTYNADHMSMYAVNSGVPKTLVQCVISWCAQNKFNKTIGKILQNICETPISPELLPPDAKGNIQQVTEDKVGPYILHDFFLYYHLHFQFSPQKILFLATKTFAPDYSRKVILKWLKTFYKRFFAQQYKRSCIPDGPKVLSISLSPRGDWRMPSDASVELWLEDI